MIETGVTTRKSSNEQFEGQGGGRNRRIDGHRCGDRQALERGRRRSRGELQGERVMNSRRFIVAVIRSPHRRWRAASAAQGRASSWSRKDLTLDHLIKDRLHVCLCKRPQRLRANISKGATAQSKRSHGDVI